MTFLTFLILLPVVILAVKKNFILQNVVNCPGEDNLPLSLKAELNNTVVIPNKIFFLGYMEAKEKINGPIDMLSEDNRCDLKSENCEKFTSFKIQGVCKSFSARNGIIFSNFLNAFHPPLKCPIMPGKYEINNASIDLSNYELLPIDGYIWISTLRVTSTDNKKKKLAMCVRIAMKITKVKESRRANRKRENNGN